MSCNLHHDQDKARVRILPEAGVTLVDWEE
jgi:hypothetical protein